MTLFNTITAVLLLMAAPVTAAAQGRIMCYIQSCQEAA